ncbi:hypothetical protein BDQ12DRAFT_668371 [Crucibulum laeve]|uniref:Uncharacterized protein n=1 Tax=Crucibulum laeve TaxID=68775 RepID=A0A5C3LS46_9AGAR|nr:hypothetical protein BDQ12DRAFT_668371 [Crucibulum laeve]
MDEAFFLLNQAEQEEEEADDELQASTIATAAFIFIGAEEAHLICAEHCRHNCLYLVCSELLSNPQIGTPWQVLYASQSDCAFITTMGFNVITFDEILASGFAEQLLTESIPCIDTNFGGAPHPGGRSVDLSGALGLVLHYLNSTM